MKKLLALLLSLLLVLSLAGCAKPGDTKMEDGVPAPGEGGSLTALWATLAGVWTGVGDSAYNFVQFTEEAGEPCFTAGILSSGYAVGGPVTAFGGSDGDYTLTVSVPAREANEMEDAREAFEMTVYLGSSHAADSWILVSDIAGDGSIREFHYAADSLEHVDESAIGGGAGGAQQSGATVYEAWNRLEGVWVAKAGDSLYFAQFSREDGEPVYQTGIPYSGYALGGTVVGFEEKAGETLWQVTVHFPAVAASEMDDGRAEMDAVLLLDYGNIEAGTVILTNLAGDGNTAVFTRMADTLDGLDYDKLMAL